MYDYEKMKPSLFTEEGVEMLMSIRDRVRHLSELAGAFSAGAAIRDETGDTWQMLACVDRLVETGEIRELTDPSSVWAQHRVFVWEGRSQ